jgi:diguanylate cyclase (GGDEF)-like protein/PAS domain S-box-containing protein
MDTSLYLCYINNESTDIHIHKQGFISGTCAGGKRMALKPKATGKAGTKAKSDLQNLSPKNDIAHLPENMISKIGIGIHITQKGRFVFVSPLLQKLSGYSKAVLLGENSLVHVHPEDRNMVKEKAIKNLKAKRNDNYEYRVIKKNGEILWLLEMVAPIRYKGERAVLGSFMDITEHKRAELALRESQNKYGEILESIEEGYYEVNLAGNLTFINDAIIRTWGYSREELLGMNYRQFTDAENAKTLFQSFNEVYRTGKPVKNIAWTIIKKDGSSMHVEASIALYKDSSGNIRGFRGVGHDITERKQAEEALRQSEEKHRSILESIEDGYFETDIAGNFVLFNDALCRIFAYTREELMGMNYKQYTDQKDSKKLFQVFNECYRTGKPKKALDLEFIRKDKAKADIAISVSLVRNMQGEPVGFRGIARDITESKRSEEALRQSEEKHRSILENIRESYFEVDLAGNYTFFNDSLRRLTGYSKEELSGMNYSQFSDKETSKIVFETCNTIYKTGEPAEGFDWQFVRKDGSKGHVEASISLRKDPAGNPVGFRGLLRDVTERKRMEKEIVQSEEKYRNILESIEEGYFEVDLAGNLTFVNDSMCRIWGYPKEEMIGLNNRQYTDEENAKKLYQTFNEVYRTGISSRAFDWQIIRKDGTVVYIEATIALRKDSAGKAIGFKGTVHNISERKQMEEALRQSEEKHRSILENIRESYFEVDLAGNFTFFNDSLCRLTGCSREELVGMNYSKFSDKDTSKIVFKTFNKVFLTGEPTEGFDWPTTRKDGIKIYVSATISLRKDPAGNPVGFRGVLRDVTERKRMEEALRQSEEKHRSILENIRESYFEVDLYGNFTFFNDSLCRLTGCSREELVGMNYSKFSDKDTSKIVFETFHKVYKTGEPSEGFDWPTTRKDGIKIFVSASISLRKDPADKPVGFRGVLRDVTERKRMEEELRQSEERHRSIIEQMHDGYFEIDLAGNFVHFNEAACQTYGYNKDEMLGLNYKQYTDRETGRKLFEVFTELYKTGIPVKAHALELIRKDGTKSFNEISVSLVKNAKGEAIGFRGIARDITERKRSEEQIRHMATHDTLTELPNRIMFGQLLNHAIRSAKRHRRQLAVLFTDLDRFKIINDTLGHEAGDLLLKTIATRFKQTLRATDVVARLGGDEFVILVEEVDNPGQLVTVAQKILSTTMRPVPLMGEECRVTASVGISIYPKDGEDEQTLMKTADKAMYFAKEEGKNNYQFYSEGLKSQSIEQLSLETHLRLALERNELSLNYQAKLDFKTDVITGVEALLRWHSPLLGDVSPAKFIPVAEETGMIVPIGQWVIKTACAQNVAWQQQGLPHVCMAVNLSFRQLLDENLIEDIKTALRDSGMAPHLLELEITESMVMHNPARMVAILTQIKDMGVRLAIDDFGTGYSSLAQIKHFPIDTLKVDRSFIRDIPQDAEDKAITQAIISMGKTLSLTVVAEGVETQDQMDFLRQHSCDEMQGYYFSKPVTPEKFADLLRSHIPAV